MFLDDIVGPMSVAEAKATKQRLDKKCWSGYKKQGTKVKGGVRVNNCVANESQLNELAAGYAANKGYSELGAYKRYNTFVSKKKFNNIAFIAVAENPRTNEVKFKATAPTQQEAVQKLHTEIDKEIEVATKVSGAATIDFNVDFVRDVLEMSSNTFYAKIVPGPKLVIAGKEMEQYPDIMKQEGFKASGIRTVTDSEGATKLPAIPLSASNAVTAQLIANGRYVLGAETIDKDGNRIFDLEFDSQVADKRERMRMGVPAITIGTKRETKEDAWHGETDAWHDGNNAWSSDNHEMVEGQPQSKLDQKIIHLLTNGIPAEAIARKLDVPVEWVHEVAEYNMPDSSIDYNDPRNVPPENRFGEGFQDFNKVEPYEVCLAGKPVKTFDYYEDARRFHDNWKKKLYREGNQAKADKITLNPIMKEGIVDTIRGKNYKRLANRSFSKAMSAQDKASDYGFADPKRSSHEDEFAQQMRKMRQRERKADELGIDDIDETATAPIIVPKRRAKEKQEPKFHIPYKASDYVPPAVQIARDEEQKKKGVKEAISKKDLLSKLAKDLNTPFKKAKAGKLKSDGSDFTKGDHWTGPDKDDPSYTRNFGHGYPNTPDNRSHDRYVNKSLKKDIDEAGSPAQQAAIAIAKKKEQGVDEAETDYSKRRQREKDIDAGKPVAKQRQSKMTDYQKRRAQQKKEMELGEGTNYWTKLQNERNTKLNSLVNELKESIKK